MRKIIHIDMDCFYAAIEMRENPALKNKPIAVGGTVAQRGVLATCNYVARKWGLHSAMPTAQAFKRCPELVLLPLNMPLYRQISAQIQQIFARYTHIIEPISLDEAYLDVTDCMAFSGSATWIAQDIRRTIWQELALTASAGVAPLKFLAKIASEQNKPNGLFVITPHEVADFVAKLPLDRLPGVGKVTGERLSAMGLKTCADIQSQNMALLFKRFGKMGQRIWQFSHGIDERAVQPNRERKSIGVEMTLTYNIVHLAQGIAVIDSLFLTLQRRIKRLFPNLALDNLGKLGVKLKFDDFHTTTLDKSQLSFNDSNFKQLLSMIWQRAKGRKIRLIGIHVYLPQKLSAQQMNLW